MAKTKNKPQISTWFGAMKPQKYLNLDYAKKLIFDPNYVAPICWLLLLGEVALNIFIVERVSYTEIDWKAYMQEVEGFLNGTLDYKLIKGDTGPCVYPAGFLYVYSGLYYVTSQGTNIKLAQYIFLTFYLLQTYLTYEIYKKTCKIPGYALLLSAATSYRIHSIFVLRLFNDPIAVLLFYTSLTLFLSGRWKLGSFLFSLAVSIKMNILLYAPCLLIAYLTNLSYTETFINLFICGVTQLILGAPFLYGNFYSYLQASFDLGRVFEHKWTVNYRFLPIEIFEDKLFHVALLGLHVILLGAFAPLIKRYFTSYYTLRKAICEMKSQHQQAQKPKVEREETLTQDQQEFLDSFERQLQQKNPVKQRKKRQAPPPQQEKEEICEVNMNKISQLFVLPFYVTNLIGIACARSLHYQFYSWYFHSLLYLVFCTPYNKSTAFLLLATLEFCWNVYPSTDVSSTLLHFGHVILLVGLYRNMKK